MMTLTRTEQLNDYLNQTRALRFKAGRHDCGLFVAGWVQIITGIDHGEQWRGHYTSLRKGYAMLKASGFETHVDLAASVLDEVHPAFAQTGDIAAIGDRSIGIFAADRVFVLRTDGLGHVSRLRAERGFTV
jgi:hypothetical protein